MGFDPEGLTKGSILTGQPSPLLSYHKIPPPEILAKGLLTIGFP